MGKPYPALPLSIRYLPKKISSLRRARDGIRLAL